MPGTAAELIKIVTSQVGVHEGRNSDGTWNNDQKYSDELPGFDWSDGQPWCDTFCGWGFWKAGLTEDEAPRSASCDASAAAWKKMGRYSEYPAIGAQVLFGEPGDYQHTGIVTKFDDTYIWTVEGNTNATGSYQGDGVYAKKHERRDPRVIGYGYPKFSHPIVSADPKWQPKPEQQGHGFAADYSFARPDPKALKAAGFAGVVRYISNGSGKDLTAAEAAKLHASGLWIALIWETTASRATEGTAAGAADVKTAEAAADRLGYPKSAVIFYAVDTDAQPDSVRPYFTAVKKGATRPVGVYGGVRVIDAQLAPHGWQTAAWSAGQVSAHADMLQRIHPTRTVKGSPDGWDENVLLDELSFPVWSPAKPAPTSHPEPEVDFYVGEVSGLWDAPVEVWKQAIAAQAIAGATVILVTETTVDGLMREVCPDGWAFARRDDEPGESECTVLWDTKARKSASKAYSTVLADTQFYTGQGHLRPKVTSITKGLEDIKAGEVDLFTVVHTPSGDTPAREQAHQETLAAIPVAWDQGREDHPDAGRVMGFDLNRDMRRPEVRQAWDGAFPMLQLCWTADNLPDRGTHGDAVIDGVAVGKGRLQVVSVRVLPTPPPLPGKKPFDHRGILVGVTRLPKGAA